ncbi:MAG: cytochrome c oxidase subunit II [Oleiphilaceae bacterium]|nr:cytochrome c oxidase subunit II [Oleiphilaceae bacterium]
MRSRLFQWALVSLLPVLWATPASAEYGLNMTRGVTDVSQSVYDLHMTIFWICVVIGVVVFGVMFYSIFKHRKSKGAVAAKFHESTTVEIIWTIIPVLILVAMAAPATTTLIEMYDTSDSEVDIKVTGYQWKWRYEYLGTGVDFFSNMSTPKDEIYNKAAKNEHYLLEVDNELVVPINKKIRFLITANDVIHSWWVPEFAVKKDAIPGFINESWTRINEPGIYRGQCTELCGKDHGFMPVVVRAVEQDEYDAWLLAKQEQAKAEAELAKLTFTLEEQMERGEKVYNTNCAACHQANGAGIPPSFPALKGSAIAVGDIEKHIEVVVNGVPGTAMQAYGNQLSDVDMAAVITYERNAWGNDTGDNVSAKDIVDFKNK